MTNKFYEFVALVIVGIMATFSDFGFVAIILTAWLMFDIFRPSIYRAPVLRVGAVVLMGYDGGIIGILAMIIWLVFHYRRHYKVRAIVELKERYRINQSVICFACVPYLGLPNIFRRYGVNPQTVRKRKFWGEWDPQKWKQIEDIIFTKKSDFWGYGHFSLRSKKPHKDDYLEWKYVPQAMEHLIDEIWESMS